MPLHDATRLCIQPQALAARRLARPLRYYLNCIGYLWGLSRLTSDRCDCASQPIWMLGELIPECNVSLPPSSECLAAMRRVDGSKVSELHGDSVWIAEPFRIGSD